MARGRTRDDGAVGVEEGDVIWGFGDERWSLGGFRGCEFSWKRNMGYEAVFSMM